MISSGATAAQVNEALAEIVERSDAADISTRSGIHDWPPIITLGNDEFRFEVNSSELTEDFQTRIQHDIAEQVTNILNTYEVNVIEVVGHTDEVPITTDRQSTMDTAAIAALSGDASISDLIPVDNAGLGLARAIAVARELRSALNMDGVTVIPMSAAQLVLSGDRLSTGENAESDSDRRRIEIRVRSSSPQSTTN